jgi:type I restriction enzyme S subunit
VPQGWEWARISTVFQLNPKNPADDNDPAGFIPMERIDATYLSSFSFAIKKWKEIKSGFTHFADGDVAMAKITPCFQNRKSMILKGLPNGIGAGTTELKVLRTYRNTISQEYLLFFLESPYFVEEASFKGTANQQRIISGYLENKLFPIPPRKEQDRIVAIVKSSIIVADRYDVAQNKLDLLNASLIPLLKKSILQEAIQGKLVAQDANDEAADVLLERIRTEKEKLLSEGKLKKKELVDSVIFKGEDNKYYEKVDGKILDISEEISFEIPNSWQWIRLGTLFSHNTGKALNRADTDGIKKKYLTTSNVYWNRFDFNEVREMFFTDPELEKCTVHKGDLLVCEGGDIGRSAIWQYDEEICIQNHIHRLRAYYPINTEFYYLVFYHYKNIGNIGGKGIGIQGLSSGALHRLIVPLPPIEEQYRITHKYNSLIASTMRR